MIPCLVHLDKKIFLFHIQVNAWRFGCKCYMSGMHGCAQQRETSNVLFEYQQVLQYSRLLLQVWCSELSQDKVICHDPMLEVVVVDKAWLPSDNTRTGQGKAPGVCLAWGQQEQCILNTQQPVCEPAYCTPPTWCMHAMPSFPGRSLATGPSSRSDLTRRSWAHAACCWQYSCSPKASAFPVEGWLQRWPKQMLSRAQEVCQPAWLDTQ